MTSITEQLDNLTESIRDGKLAADTGAPLQAPVCVLETVERFERELARKEDMIADLNRLAEDNHGMDPEDCDALMCHVSGRDHLKTALKSIRAIFS